jgi:hypothetical protein
MAMVVAGHRLGVWATSFGPQMAMSRSNRWSGSRARSGMQSRDPSHGVVATGVPCVATDRSSSDPNLAGGMG